jgi:hypothetical protein
LLTRKDRQAGGDGLAHAERLLRYRKKAYIKKKIKKIKSDSISGKSWLKSEKRDRSVGASGKNLPKNSRLISSGLQKTKG